MSRRNSRDYVVLIFHLTNELDTALRGSLLKGQTVAFGQSVMILEACLLPLLPRAEPSSEETKLISHLSFGRPEALSIPRGSQEQRLGEQTVL